jgi:hypothetical protein
MSAAKRPGGAVGVRLAVAAAAVLAAGCTSYLGVRPLSPAYNQRVSDLQPTFTWEADPDPGVTYDLVVYAPTESGEQALMQKKQVYYREGLKGSSHRIETRLDPDKTYTWSIRARRGDEVSEWTMQKFVFNVIVISEKRIRLPCFATPAR